MMFNFIYQRYIVFILEDHNGNKPKLLYCVFILDVILICTLYVKFYQIKSNQIKSISIKIKFASKFLKTPRAIPRYVRYRSETHFNDKQD